ncbi:30S ribosomal protein S12 [Pseudooceanicola batsensis HTCC2597]|uniref:30S ribosomal protein S12 n=1 Tax=Pseudooceanicola batsensis (strain ATCC BAA-863 / DSM 15984 / KCTC 12145 / HTCC2597) TaxID=252305 RepID=A3TU71_PSEBH|nr:DUF4189 domain-containing protein [Pseudooceanicola batsensis]EAQ04067.1 30S ribosomal protein S12 [Pseudooceanicola batsensis HTCC2597]
MIRVALISVLALVAAPVSVSAETYGAIAYSFQSDKYGRAWNYGSRQEAEKAAIGFCKAAGGKRCKIGVWLQDTCGAFSVSETSRNMKQAGSSWGFTSSNAAHGRAVQECEARDGAGTCHVVASVCSNGK